MNTTVSIVSGTYNRLTHLKKMVESVRYSVGLGISYEIVLVDGGSTDGTIQWCRMQPDVMLIEQGALLGAVKAFNAGAVASSGAYVILANDDILFVDESIQTAVAYMQDNSDVGVGCFYQDRYNKPWHVEYMSAIQNGVVVSVPYGQVCIVPKWLGDKLGWWGNYLRTYGGDNELSCNVLEYGYKVQPIECCKIHDITVVDKLRELNNPEVKVNPDSAAWVTKWTRNGKLGPVIKAKPAEANPIERLPRILYAPIYEPGHAKQRVQKFGLRKALAKRGLVTEVDWIGETFHKVWDVACAFSPDIFLLQVQNCALIKDTHIIELKSQHPNAVFVNWNGDYHPEDILDVRYISLMKQFNLACFVTTKYHDIWKRNGIEAFYWQIGFEEAFPNKYNMPSHDILFMGNAYSDKRLRFGKLLKSMKYNVGIYGSWPKGMANGNTIYDFSAGEVLYRNCKIALGDSQWQDATGFVSNRLFQAMHAGAFLLQQSFDGCQELLGLKDGKHLVLFDTELDMISKIEYYLEHEDERKAIASAGKAEVDKNHSFDARVTELFNKLAKMRLYA